MEGSDDLSPSGSFPGQSAAPSIGGGRYALVAKVAQGGMAGVYRAWDAQLRVWRAVKVLLPEYANRDSLRGRFEREAAAMALLNDPHVVRVFDVVTDEALPFMVMELVEGGTLIGWLDAYGRMPAVLATTVLEQVARGLGAAHAAGVVHRDVKPHNVLITAAGQCKVTDFGIARVRGLGQGDTGMTRTGSTMGTIGYMAPEQRADAKYVDLRADVYSLGALLYKLLTGAIVTDLFLVEHEPDLLEEVPELLHELILRACFHDRERRYPDTAALIETLAELRPLLAPDPADTPPLPISLKESPPAPGAVPFPEIAVLLGQLPASATPGSAEEAWSARPVDPQAEAVTLIRDPAPSPPGADLRSPEPVYRMPQTRAVELSYLIEEQTDPLLPADFSSLPPARRPHLERPIPEPVGPRWPSATLALATLALASWLLLAAGAVVGKVMVDGAVAKARLSQGRAVRRPGQGAGHPRGAGWGRSGEGRPAARAVPGVRGGGSRPPTPRGSRSLRVRPGEPRGHAVDPGPGPFPERPVGVRSGGDGPPTGRQPGPIGAGSPRPGPGPHPDPVPASEPLKLPEKLPDRHDPGLAFDLDPPEHARGVVRAGHVAVTIHRDQAPPDPRSPADPCR